MSKLTKQFVESEIELPATGQRFYRDDDLPGFAIRVTPKSKSYVLEKRVDGVNRRITICKCSQMSLDSAKKQACIMLGDIAKGNDPKTGRRITSIPGITLREVLQKFLETKPIRKDTKRGYHYAINRHLNDWLDMPIDAVTKDMVEQRHHELTVSPNRLGTSGHGRANNALKKFGTLWNFAKDRFGDDDEQSFKTNPISRLSQNRSWHRIHPRQNIIPEHKLKDWYRAVVTLEHEVARDFLLFLLLTGMRFGESSRLQWCHVDFENKILIVPRELTKSDREHRLPLSDYLVELLKKRYRFRKQSQWVFQSCRLKDKPISGGVGFIRRVRAKSGIHFTFHDLRRGFLSTGEKMGVPTYALKRLVNHSVSNDMTGRYLILDIERLRSHMICITNEFLEKLGITGADVKEWKPAKEADQIEFTQLLIPINEIRIL